MKKFGIIIVLSLLAVSMLSFPLLAEAAYPEKEITIVVPHSPGGGTGDQGCAGRDPAARRQWLHQ